MNTSVADAAGGVAGYERLRRSAFGERVEEPGLGLLLRRGLRAWIEGRMATTAPICAKSGGVPESEGTGMREELTRLIAAMVIGTARTEARS